MGSVDALCCLPLNAQKGIERANIMLENVPMPITSNKMTKPTQTDKILSNVYQSSLSNTPIKLLGEN